MTIARIIARMETLSENFSRDPACFGFLPFLHTYLLITQAVARERDQNFFDHSRDVDALDVHFASLYFRPLERFLETGAAEGPWKTYFAYCGKAGGSPFLQMLLGINAHINGDLPCTLAHIFYRRREDFLRINGVLKGEIPGIMSYLAFERKDPIALGGLVFKSFLYGEFEKVVVRWRMDAWQSARALESSRLTEEGLRKKTEAIAEALIEIFSDFFELKRVPSQFKRLNRLRISLP